MVQVRKLIRQIQDALLNEGLDTPVEPLAIEYARLYAEVNRRVETCAVMLEKGSEYQALQLAETEPALLDLIALLSFAEANEWLDFCSARNLPVPEKLDLRSVQKIDKLYAKGISANHPLYREYRSAVMSKNDSDALRVIRSIARLNAQDTNAKAELERLENKFLQLKLKQLKTLLPDGNSEEVLQVLEEIEGSAREAKLETLPEVAEARQLRLDAARRHAAEECRRILSSLVAPHSPVPPARLGAPLQRMALLQREHQLRLTPTEAAQIEELTRLFEQDRLETQTRARFEADVNTLVQAVEAVKSRLLLRASLQAKDLQSLLQNLNRVQSAAVAHGRPIHPDLLQEASRQKDALRAEIEHQQHQAKQKKMLLGACAGVVAAALMTLGVTLLGARQYVSQVHQLREKRKVLVAETTLREVRELHPWMAATPSLKTSLHDLEQWIQTEKIKANQATQIVADVEKRLSTVSNRDGYLALTERIDRATKEVEAAAPDLLGESAVTLRNIKKDLESRIVSEWSRNLESTEAAVGKLEKEATDRLKNDRQATELAAALEEIAPRVKSLEITLTPWTSSLRVPSDLQKRTSELREKTEAISLELSALSKLTEQMKSASNLDAFRSTLEEMQNSGLKSDKDVSAAARLLSVFPKPEDLLIRLVLSGENADWRTLKEEVSKPDFYPKNVLPEELRRLFSIRDDEFLKEVWELGFVDYRKNAERRELFCVGDLKMQQMGTAALKTTYWFGKILDPLEVGRANAASFIPRKIVSMKSATGVAGDGEITSKNPSAATEFLSALELNRMTNNSGSKYERSLFRIFDLIVSRPSKSPILKAYLMLTLKDLYFLRPDEWGGAFCKSLKNDLKRLEELCSSSPIGNQDWLNHRKSLDYENKLTAYFSGLKGHSYYAEAQVYREIVQKALEAGIHYGGFMDCDGKSHLLGSAKNQDVLWLYSVTRKRLVKFPREASPPTGGFSPVFVIPVDLETLARQAQQKAGATGAQKVRLDLPFLDTP
jgi:hypothetical protein